MALPTVTQVKCAACGRQYTQQVHQAVDAKKEPQLKSMLLQGRLNLTACPQCGTQGPLSMPMLYHDPDKSLFLILQPMDLRGGVGGNQQAIGMLSSQFMQSLPAEERRGYMFQPKLYLSLQSMVDDIMMADGITREEIAAARERTALLEQLAQSTTLEDLTQKVEQNRDKIDDAFFEVLDGYIEQAGAGGDSETAQLLSDLRDDLVALVQPEGEGGRKLEIDREEVLGLLENERDPERMHQLVAVARPALDYYFFQIIADRIEQAQTGGNEIETRRLTKLRDSILATMDELDQQARQALTDGASLIREAVAQKEPESFLRENSSRLNDAFFAVLNANIGEAQRRQDEPTARALAALGAVAVKVLQESAPPEVRLINAALQAKPEQRREMLLAQKELLTDQTVAMVDQMLGSLRSTNPRVATELQAVRGLIDEIRAES